MRKITLLISVLFIVISLTLSGCSANYITKNFDLDKITVSIQDPIPFAEGLDYNIVLTNGSKSTIKQLNVLFGFNAAEEFKGSNGNNTIMYYAKPNRESINIEPNETVSYHVHVPLQLLKEELFDFNNIQLQIVGYKSEIKSENRFEKWGPLTGFMMEEK